MLPQVFLILFGCFVQFVTADSLFALLQPHGLIRTSNSRVYGRQASVSASVSPPASRPVPTSANASVSASGPAPSGPVPSSAPGPAGLPMTPPQCKSDCDPIITIVNSVGMQGCQPSECCQASFVTGYFNCLKCAGAAENITNYGSAQLVLDELTAACDAKGLQVPKQTLPGQDPNRPLPSAPSLPSGTLPPSATNQQTITGLPTSVPPLSASVTAPPVTTSSTSSAVSTRFFTPQFSHLMICAVSFVVWANHLG